MDFMLQADWLLLEGANDTSLYLAREFRKAGKQVVVDADGYSDMLYNNMDAYDHFIASEFFYKKVYGDSTDYEKNLRELYERKGGRGVMIVTLGENGMVGIDEEGKFFSHPAFKIKVIDTTGAGDIFHGAYIVGRLEGMDASEASVFASATSAIACTVLGGRAGLTTIAGVKHFIETGEIDYTDIEKNIEHYRQCPLL